MHLVFNAILSLTNVLLLFFQGPQKLENLNITIILSCVVGAGTLFTVMAFVYFFFCRKNLNNRHIYGKADMEEKEPQACTVDLSHLFMIEHIGHGRYGTVWKAKLNDNVVAVKVFSPENKVFWQTEVDFYKSLEFKSSPYILRVRYINLIVKFGLFEVLFMLVCCSPVSQSVGPTVSQTNSQSDKQSDRQTVSRSVSQSFSQ